MTFPVRRAGIACALLAASLVGCQRQEKNPPSVQPAAHSAATVSLAELHTPIRQALEYTQRERTLSLKQHAAWQILHGVLAYGRAFAAEDHGTMVPVVDYLKNGGQLSGWDWEPVAAPGEDQLAVRLLTAPGTKAGQGHADQWLAVLAQAGVSPGEPFRFGEYHVPMIRLIDQMLRDVHRNVEREYSWTLIAALAYYPTTHRWIAGDGRQWSIEQLVEVELEYELATSACGGTHRLIGLATALGHRRAEKAPITGVWDESARRIQWAAKRARALQNDDGSFSTNYFERPGAHPDLKEHLGATGHTLEFLAISQPPSTLSEPWVRRAVARLCHLFDITRTVPLECGALYHAAHGLSEYLEKTRLADRSS